MVNPKGVVKKSGSRLVLPSARNQRTVPDLLSLGQERGDGESVGSELGRGREGKLARAGTGESHTKKLLARFSLVETLSRPTRSFISFPLPFFPFSLLYSNEPSFPSNAIGTDSTSRLFSALLTSYKLRSKHNCFSSPNPFIHTSSLCLYIYQGDRIAE